MEAAVPEAATKQWDNVEETPPRSWGPEIHSSTNFPSAFIILLEHSPSLDAFLRSQASPPTGEHEAVVLSSFREDLLTFTDYYLGLVQAASLALLSYPSEHIGISRAWALLCAQRLLES